MQRGRKSTRPYVPCERCSTYFKSIKSNPNRFCSARCKYLSARLPDDVVQKMRELWADGMTTSLIGEQTGHTKNSVIGVSHRYPGFAPRPSPLNRGGPMSSAFQLADAERRRQIALARAEAPTAPIYPGPEL